MVSRCVISNQGDFESVLVFDLEEGLGVSAGVVDGMMGVPGFSEVFEVRRGVLDDALVERSEVHGAVAEGVSFEEVMEVPVDELPIETVVVGDEDRMSLGNCRNPGLEFGHDRFRIVELQGLLARETADSEGFGDPFVRDGFETSVEGLVQRRFDDDGAEADHGIVAGDGAVGFDVDHNETH